MHRSRRFLLILLPLFMLLLGFRQAPLVDPPPIDIPDGMSVDKVAKAIEISLIRRGWEASNKTAQGLDATLHLREHTATIHVAWDARAIRINYVSSTNLKYEQSSRGREIHKNYLGWIQNLVTDIRANLVLLR